jgi:hypothetical protein
MDGPIAVAYCRKIGALVGHDLGSSVNQFERIKLVVIDTCDINFA